jgi:hypothetical protein
MARKGRPKWFATYAASYEKAYPEGIYVKSLRENPGYMLLYVKPFGLPRQSSRVCFLDYHLGG